MKREDYGYCGKDFVDGRFYDRRGDYFREGQDPCNSVGRFMENKMKPVEFPQQNIDWKKPRSMTDEECSSLPAYRDEEHSISCWHLDWKERLKVLFTGQVWLWIWMGGQQPPVMISTKLPWPKKRKENAEEDFS